MSDKSSVAFLDTNVLVHASYVDVPSHHVARSLLLRAKHGELSRCVSPQVLLEFYSIVTNPRRVTNPRAPEDALSAILAYISSPGFTILPFPVDRTARWVALARRYPVTGAEVFDLQLVATMRGNGVRQLYTFNESHFRRITEIVVLTP